MNNVHSIIEQCKIVLITTFERLGYQVTVTFNLYVSPAPCPVQVNPIGGLEFNQPQSYASKNPTTFMQKEKNPCKQNPCLPQSNFCSISINKCLALARGPQSDWE